MRLWLSSSVVLCALALTASGVRADTLSAVGGLSFGRSSGLNDLKPVGSIIGMEYSLPVLSMIEIGGFYNFTGVNTSSGQSDTINFMGAMVRFAPGGREGFTPFFDLRFGAATRTEQSFESSLVPSAGVGAGIRIPVSKVVSISPRIDANSLPDAAMSSASHQTLIDGVVLISLHL